MKKVILLLLLSCISIVSIAQSLRTVNGVVFNEKGAPMKGVLIKPNTEQDGVLSSDNGTFTIKVSPYAKKIYATFDGYFTETLEIDGSYLVFNMKINKEYLELKLKAEKETAAKSIPAKGFGSFIDIVYQYYQPFTGYHDYIGVHYIGGYRFNKKCFLGAGVGLNASSSSSKIEKIKYVENSTVKLPDAKVVIPVYAYFRLNLIDKKCSPFIALAAGGKFAKTQYLGVGELKYAGIGAFINPQLGVNFQVTPRSKFYFAVGVNGYNMHTLNLYNWHYKLQPSVYYGLDFHIGFSF